jgi:hypothetical protein
MRSIKGRPLNLAHTFLADDEETPLTLDAVTVTLRDGMGESVATSPATDAGNGVWTVTFPAQPLGPYTVEWDGGDYMETDYAEVVGGFLFSVTQARNSDDYLKDASAFPADEIIAYREVVEGEFQDIAARSFTTRVMYANYVSDGTGDFAALIPDAQAVEAVWIDGEPVDDVSGWSVSTLGIVSAPDIVREGVRVRARIRYGFITPPPKVAQAGMIRLRNLMAAENSGIPDRATTWQPEEGGTFRLATPGLSGFETGIPEVDATLKRYTLDSVLAMFAANG